MDLAAPTPPARCGVHKLGPASRTGRFPGETEFLHPTRNRPEGIGTAERSLAEGGLLVARCSSLARAIDEALQLGDLRAAATALWEVVVEANRFVSATRPWELAQAERAGASVAAERLDAVLGLLDRTCRTIAHELSPFLPEAAGRITRALDEQDARLARSLFPKFQQAI